MAGAFSSAYSSAFDSGSGFAGTSAGVATVSGSLTVLGSNNCSGTAAGATTVSGALFEVPLVSSVGRGFISFAYLDNGFAELAATIEGEGFNSAALVQTFVVPYRPVNYPFNNNETDIENLFAALVAPDGALSSPRATAYGKLDIEIAGSSTGDADADLGDPDNPYEFETEVYGEGFVTAELFVGGGIAELAAEIYGEGFVFAVGDLDFDFGNVVVEAYYQYGNIHVGFYPDDDVAGLDSNSFADGSIIEDFARYLYQYVDVGVGFDYTDDASGNPGFVSQSYPDGDIIRDWGRFLHEYVNIIEGIVPPDCRLTVGPAPRRPQDLTPTPRPPRQ